MIRLSFLQVALALDALVGAAYAQVGFATPERPESTVASPDTFYVGQFASNGTILKYSLNGELADDFTAPILANVRGLAINQASDTLWAAFDTAVVEMILTDDNQATPIQYYNLSDIGMAEPNGLCLSPNEDALYVTDPNARSLAKIDFANNSTSAVVSPASDEPSLFSPNGYVAVEGESGGTTVWMIHRNGNGIQVFMDTDTESVVGPMEPFSVPIINQTTPLGPGQPSRFVGDGIVWWDYKLYASVWATAPPFEGTIFVCEPYLNGTRNTNKPCQVFLSGPLAADLQLDDKTPNQPQLILPSLITKQVATVPLVQGEDDPEPEIDPEEIEPEEAMVEGEPESDESESEEGAATTEPGAPNDGADDGNDNNGVDIDEDTEADDSEEPAPTSTAAWRSSLRALMLFVVPTMVYCAWEA
jgi:hypothetical protein